MLNELNLLHGEKVTDVALKYGYQSMEEQKEEMHSLQNIDPYEIVNASYEADANFLKEKGI